MSDSMHVLIGVIVVAAMILTGFVFMCYYLNQGAIRENKLATECMQAGGVWKHGQNQTGSMCVWGNNPG